MIPPGSTLGVLGGGQLGRMLAHAATRMGYHLHVYEPAEDCPAGEVATREFNSPYKDIARLQDFARTCAAVTYEFENVPVEPLWEIEKLVPLRPHWEVLEVCQNRMREKKWLKRHGFPHVPFAEVEAGGDMAKAIKRIGMPCVVKTADFGYDGKGQLKVTSAAAVATATQAFAKQRAVVERFIDFKCELSVIVARNSAGETRTFPVVENIHTHHILDFTIAPARVSESVTAAAAKLAVNIAEAFGLVGILAVELFLTDEGELLVNEMAPRTHNSGHWTLDGCVTSQFEQQIRAVAGLPLGDTAMTVPAAIMVNILGDAWQWEGDSPAGAPDWNALLQEPRAKLHLYGKSEPRRGRKMGHFTVTGDHVDQTFDLARDLKDVLRGATD
ncbi:5-(carboxyamino)imidazole ribonucleotide synthase [Synoicihabitans lomoniglobus]|uniref:N5-carboxyaminoimidazole ribonucleotide synthase n=1 Tax=Synoicihabitans lomoniglobus TaxID=2909285 RepID=A0AAE9ZWR0_9BACT|nr:5-(carboxyamino)imidazole ribonucleotide synthase [Opitutaceae bacterium LMO-M01]WED63923.1 5-(carboxyamino)imidazole ribonucleotide synthase [Opitutaceae bacterium LMO-M01]